MSSFSGFDLIGGLYVVIAIATFVEVWRKGRSLWSGPVHPTEWKLLIRVAFFLVYPFVVLIHEAGHAAAAWATGQTIVAFEWMLFWGSVTHVGGASEIEHWWIAVLGTLASLVAAGGLILMAYRGRRLGLAIRAVAMWTGLFSLVFGLITYPLMSFAGVFGDWVTIYRFGATPLASSLALVVHVVLVVLLLLWNVRVEERSRTAIASRGFAASRSGRFTKRAAVLIGASLLVAATYRGFEQPGSIYASGGLELPPGYEMTDSGRELYRSLDVPAGIVVADQLFGRGEYRSPRGGPISRDFSDTSVLIATDEGEKAADALRRAGQRFMFVGEDGTELADDHPAFESGDVFTPGYVSDVYRTPKGPALVVDYDGELLPDAVRLTYVAILLEELQRGEVGSALLTRAPPETDWPVWMPLWPEPSEAESIGS
jgi:hypothetical protein